MRDCCGQIHSSDSLSLSLVTILFSSGAMHPCDALSPGTPSDDMPFYALPPPTTEDETPPSNMVHVRKHADDVVSAEEWLQLATAAPTLTEYVNRMHQMQRECLSPAAREETTRSHAHNGHTPRHEHEHFIQGVLKEIDDLRNDMSVLRERMAQFDSPRPMHPRAASIQALLFDIECTME
jgi:hypothetical protein